MDEEEAQELDLYPIAMKAGLIAAAFAAFVYAVCHHFGVV